MANVSMNGPAYMSLPYPMIWVGSEDMSGQSTSRVGGKNRRWVGAVPLRL